MKQDTKNTLIAILIATTLHVLVWGSLLWIVVSLGSGGREG